MKKIFIFSIFAISGLAMGLVTSSPAIAEASKIGQAPQQGSLSVCATIVNQDGDIIRGKNLDGQLSVTITGPDGFNEVVRFNTELDFNDNLLTDNGSTIDAECKTYRNIDLTSTFRYSQAQISGNQDWQEPLYTDFFNEGSESISVQNLERYNASESSDGQINVIKNRTHRKLLIVSQVTVDDSFKDLVVQCEPDDDEVEIDERLTWRANVSGGDGTYQYDWDGDEGLDGTNRTVSIYYDDEGIKDARVQVRSGDGQTATDTCSVRIEEEDDDSFGDDDDDFQISCEVSDTRIDEGDRITFDVDIDGGDSPFDVEWYGDIRDIDDFDRNDRRQTVRIDEAGRYDIRVDVRDDDGERATDRCRLITVEDDRGTVAGVSVTSTTATVGRTGQVAGVALSQVPYTGFTDNPVLNAILYSFAGLTVLVIGMVSLFIVRKKDVVLSPVSQSTMTVETNERYTEDEIVSALEDVAHKKKVIVSSDAMSMLIMRSKRNKVKAMMFLNQAIDRAKSEISTEAWLVMSKDKIADVL